MKRIILALLLMWALPVAGKDRPQPTPEECEQFHAGLEEEKALDAAGALWTEGEARFDGYCFPKDTRHGLDLIERAVANGAGDAALTLRILYGELGDAPGIAKWTPLAALALHNAFPDGVHEEIDGTRIPADVLAEWREIVETLASADVARIVARLDRLASRPPVLLKAEWGFWLDATRAIMSPGAYEWHYQFARGLLIFTPVEDLQRTALSFLHSAANCGHPAAARDQVSRFLADLPIHGDASRVVRSLAQVHHTTGRYSDLLERAERKLGRPAYRDTDELIADLPNSRRPCLTLRR